MWFLMFGHQAKKKRQSTLKRDGDDTLDVWKMTLFRKTHKWASFKAIGLCNAFDANWISFRSNCKEQRLHLINLSCCTHDWRFVHCCIRSLLVDSFFQRRFKWFWFYRYNNSTKLISFFTIPSSHSNSVRKKKIAGSYHQIDITIFGCDMVKANGSQIVVAFNWRLSGAASIGLFPSVNITFAQHSRRMRWKIIGNVKRVRILAAYCVRVTDREKTITVSHADSLHALFSFIVTRENSDRTKFFWYKYWAQPSLWHQNTICDQW